jgi:2'-hydroxyisoflavone reductase
MKLLVLGGTKFLGRQVVETALARGDEVTLFNRGLHNAEMFPDVEKLRGDRDGGLGVLRGRRWDAVVDTSGYVPRLVRASSAALADSVDLYVFISTVSVYADFSRPIDEDSPVRTLADESIEEVTGEAYGPLKAMCERAAVEVLPGRVLNVRPGLIVGPYDPSGRFTYWTERVARGGEVLAPAPPDRQVQFVDARDLSEWILRMADARRAGVFNADGPDYRLTMGDFLEACRAGCDGDASFTWVGEQFLLDAGVQPWGGLPLWIPESDDALRHFLSINCQRALDAGLTFRPVAETARDTFAWQRAGSPGIVTEGQTVQSHTLTPERERELLDAWRREEEGRRG